MSETPNKLYLSANNAAEMRQLLTDIFANYLLMQNVQATGGGGTSRPLPTDVKGRCYLKFYFVGTIQNTNKTHRVEKSFRLMKEDPRTISLERLKYFATTIWNKFNNFTFTTGHDSWCYNDPEVGFNRIWGYFNSQADAQKLFEQLLDIIGESPKWHHLTRSTVPIPGDRFSPLPDKVQQAGVLIRPDQERPIALMKFSHATIKFPHLRKETDLVTPAGSLINSLDFATQNEQLSFF